MIACRRHVISKAALAAPAAPAAHRSAANPAKVHTTTGAGGHPDFVIEKPSESVGGRSTIYHIPSFFPALFVLLRKQRLNEWFTWRKIC